MVFIQSETQRIDIPFFVDMEKQLCVLFNERYPKKILSLVSELVDVRKAFFLRIL